MKTIKQLSEELGVSKQKVYRYIKKNCINEALQRNGMMYYDEAVEVLLKRELLKNSASSEVHHEAHQTASNDAEMMQFLKQQLQVKDQQIEQLQDQISQLTMALENTTASLKASQALHAGTIQQQIEYKDKKERSGIWPWRKK